MKAMVMAAGAGTRLQPLTFSVPKPMVPVANRPVLEYILDHLRSHGITDLILNLHSHPDMIRRHFKDGAGLGLRITYSHEPRLLGTAGGVKKVASLLQDAPFLIMSGDGLTDINLTRLIRFHRERRSHGTLAMKAVDTRFDYGITLTQSNGRIKRFIEKPKWGDVFSNQVNTGIYLFEPGVLSEIPAKTFYDFGKQVWPKLLKKRAPIFAHLTKDYWCDIGNLIEYRRAQKDVLDGHVRVKFPGRKIRPGVWMDEGVRLESGVKIEGPVLIGKNSRIERGARLGPYTIIGENNRIGRNSVLRHCTLWNDVRVGKRARLDRCIAVHGTRVHDNSAFFEGILDNPASNG